MVAGLSNITAIECGGDFAMALASDGRIWTWGDNSYGQLGSDTGGVDILTPQQIAALSAVTITAISAVHCTR